MCFSIHRKVRSWMDDQNTKFTEKVKEAKHKVAAAKQMVINIFDRFPVMELMFA